MLLYTTVCILLAFSLSSLFCVTYGQFFEVPYIACPNYFQYFDLSGSYIGKISLPNSVYDGTTEIEVEFSQRYPVEWDYFGKMSHYEGEENTKKNLKRRSPVLFRIDFPLRNELPKLTKIAIDGNVICSDREYSYPSTPIAFTYPAISTKATVPGKDFHQSEVCGLEGTGVSSGRSATVIIVPRIYGGSPLREGQYPWITAIYIKKDMGKSMFCGGSLISASFILSAAHCVHDSRPEMIMVELGRHDLNDRSENVVPRDIRTIVVHPDYVHRQRGVHSDADLALLRLKNPLDGFTESIRPICLWTESVDESLILGQTATVAGWGAEDSRDEISPIPKNVETVMASSSVCSDPGSDRTLCAGKLNGEGTCHGDSGGALMMWRNERWVLRGIVSGGYEFLDESCNNFAYSMYCDVAKHMTWVLSYL